MTPYEQKNMSYKFASFLVDNPFKAIFFALLLIAALVPGIRYMQADFSYRIWFLPDDPMLERFDAFERRFGNDEMVAVVVHSPSGIFDAESITLVQTITEQMWQVSEVMRVDSLTNYNWTHSEEDELMVEPLVDDELPLTEALLAERRKVALEHEVIPGYLISEDGNTSVIYAQLKPAIGTTPDFELVANETRAILAKLGDDQKTVVEGPGDHRIYLTGPSMVSHTFKEVTQADLSVMVPTLLGALMLFLFISFRRVSGVIIPFLLIVTSICLTLGFAGWLGFKFNNLTATVPHILIAISVADAVHILVTFFQFRGTGMERREAALKTLTKNLQPTLLTSISTAIGFFSFSSAKIVPIVHMGILAGTGTLFAWAITIFLITPMLVFLPIKVKFKQTMAKHDEPHPLAMRYSIWLRKKRRMVMGVFAIVITAAIFTALQNEVNSNPFKYFAKNVPTRVANEFAEAQVGGMQGMEITIDSGATDGIKDPVFLGKVEAFQNWLDGLDHVTKTLAVTDIIKQTNRSLHGDQQEAYVIPDNQELVAQEIFLYTMSLPVGMDLNNRITLDNDMIRMTAMSTLHDSKESLAAIAEIEAKAAEMGLSANVTGKMPLYHNMNPYVVSAFLTSITMALFLVSILMIIVFKSWKLGLLSMIPNTVPLVLGGAMMMVLGKPLDIGTVLVTSTCLGIAVDDTIHFLSNYNRWRKLGSTPEEAVAHVITHTGPALFVTTLVLVVGFATFAFSSFVPNINFGIMTAIVLSTALFTDGTLLPAILMGRKRNRKTLQQPVGKAA